MAIRYDFEQLRNAPLETAYDFGQRLANGARGVACNLYSRFPAALIPNVGDSLARGLYDTLCDDLENPPPPSVPFTGGQCAVAYSIVFQRSFRQISTGNQVNQPNLSAMNMVGPISQSAAQVGQNQVLRICGAGGACQDVGGVNNTTNDQISQSIVSVTRIGGGADNCGNPPPQFPPSVIPPGEEDEDVPIPVGDGTTVNINFAYAPVQTENNVNIRVNNSFDIDFDLGGVNINLPNTGGGGGSDPTDGGGGGGGYDTDDRLRDVDTRERVIQIENNQAVCCEEITEAIAELRELVIGRFDNLDLVNACIVGLIRENAALQPRLTDPSDARAIGVTGVSGDTLFVSPSRANSCFLVIECALQDDFRGKVYKFDSTGARIEANRGHVERGFRATAQNVFSEGGVETITARFTLVRFPDISTENSIRLSLAGNVSFSVTDPGYSWVPRSLPQCDEIVVPV